MKWFRLIVPMVCLAFSGVCEGVELREFVMKDGESIYAEIRDYNNESDVLKLYTDAGKLVQIKAAALRDEDFIYVRDWDAVRKFKENTHFRLYIDGPYQKNQWAKFRWLRRPGKVEPNKTHETYFERMNYVIRFDNQTGYDLENVTLKYNIFYKQERMDFTVEEKVEELIVRPAMHLFTIVPADAKEKMESKSIVLRRKEILGGNRFYFLEGEGRRMRSELLGMIFRISIETASGQTAVRERRVPQDLSDEYVWMEPTEENIVWPDDDLDETEDTKRPPTTFELMGGSETADES